MRLAIFSSLILASTGLVSASSCRCRPEESCWPAEREWESLNRTTQGRLHTLRPVGAVCHGSAYNYKACNVTKEYESSSIWRADHPAAVQYSNWEMWPEQNQSCYIDAKRSIPCGQGRVSLYTIEAESPHDIQAGVTFARTHNLRLAIRNTGHSYQGRSTAPESLQINTHLMKNKTLHKNFKPAGYNGKGKIEPLAVTLDAGVQLFDMYTFCGENGVMAVGGSSHGVGAAGGYIQGGGHSMFAGVAGMASDNALEFHVVVADGRHVIANEYQNSDLFWALRGGGGGTWGVVTSVTVRAFPDPPIVGFTFSGGGAFGSDSYWDAVEYLNSFLPEFNEAGGAMYYYLVPDYTVSGEQVSMFYAEGGFANHSDVAKVNKLMKPFIKKLGEITGSPFNYTATLTPKATSLFTTNFKGPDGGGIPVILGSRLITRDLLKSADGPKQVTDAVRSLKTIPGNTSIGYEGIQGLVTVGPQVWANSDLDSALHPIWRETQLHLIIARGWDVDTPFEEQQIIQNNLTQVEVPILKKLDPAPKGGAYLNEADAYDEDWKSTFWGPNYPRLRQIKQKWDPEGLFIVRTGVGSEDWDNEGLCRK
ncbi:FAD/FMN-containing isoamyl alcohol oxidase MreA-like protein [Penicillium angulare]|uniref:FAD/FMN-containing isoamyl alcohol oxidase MreA-like protein n=1 Tax=Penicillium angulare TaxID=116970 RepID=UPI00254255C1|nr:FAD/FMN-containing isoamyl alcohol oxidase MreA-like protein [Penicillium angulare]KAJ5289000.1 FAD/FMN-containing isoamyl alcohol oxidase MreA-like protein [Penicillium angulare]